MKNRGWVLLAVLLFLFVAGAWSFDRVVGFSNLRAITWYEFSSFTYDRFHDTWFPPGDRVFIEDVRRLDRFEEIVTSNHLVLVYYGASWCLPCRNLIGPINRTVFACRNLKMIEVRVGPEWIAGDREGPTLNADIIDDPDVKSARGVGKFHIDALPAMMLFRDGQLVDTVVGDVSSSGLLFLLRHNMHPALNG
jgi:thiol-disulfide isomerase/thioredoxin